MPELREDVTSGRRVIVAAGRAGRPHGFAEEAPVPERPGLVCPFCPGNEGETPPEGLVLPGGAAEGAGGAGSTGWRVRVVPNRFPALAPEGGAVVREGLFPHQPACGAHEVIVDTPEHGARLGEYPAEQLRLLLAAMVRRLARWQEEPWALYPQLFKNVGHRAGASLSHPHHQLMVLPFVPPVIVQEVQAARQFWEAEGECVLCRLARAEAGGPREVETSSRFAAFCPFASRFPYEVWLVPWRHVSRLEELGDEELEDLAGLLPRTAARLEESFPGLAYNVVYHTAPWKQGQSAGSAGTFHWHVEFLPRLTSLAGFELASGVYVNPTPPEEAAALLRRSGRHSDAPSRRGSLSE